MVAPVITEQQEQRWREDYRASFAQYEPTPDDWHSHVKHQAAKYLNSDKTANWSAFFITQLLGELDRRYPPTLDGYIDYQRDLHVRIATRKAQLRGEKPDLPLLDTTTIHQRICWRVIKDRNKPMTYKLLGARPDEPECVIDTNEVIAQLDAISMKPSKAGGACHGTLLVYFHYTRNSLAVTYRQVTKVEPATLTDDERGFILDMVEVLGVDRFGTVDDSLIDDPAVLARFVETGWVMYRKTDKEGIQYSVPERTATIAKAGEPMATKQPQPQQAAIPATQTKRWCDDDVMWQQMRKSTAANLISANIEYGDIDSVLLEICGNVTSRDNIIISQDEFYKAQTAWIKEHAKPVSVLDQRFPRTADGQPVDDDDIDDTEDDDPTLPGRVPGATEYPDMPEPGSPKASKFPVATLQEDGDYWTQINNLFVAHDVPSDAQRDNMRHDAQGGKSAKELPATEKQAVLKRLKAILDNEFPNKASWQAWVKPWLDKGYKFNDILSILAAGDGHPIASFAEYGGTLSQATKYMIEDTKENPIAPNQQPGTASETVSQPTQTSPKQESPKKAVSGGSINPAANPFKKAKKENSKLRMMLAGVAGGGKTYTALDIARKMFPDGKIAVIDTERGSASKYADLFDFDVLELAGDYAPERYIELIHVAEQFGYDVLIIDSASHEWEAENGVLDQVDEIKAKQKNPNDTRSAWKEMTPRHRAFITAIQTANLHVIVTARAEEKEVVERDEQKRVTTKKLAFTIKQRNGINFEFDIVAKLDSTRTLTIDKSRCSALTDFRGKITDNGQLVADRIREWLGLAA